MDVIEGRTDIVRDPVSGAIINIDSNSYQAAVSSNIARQSAKEQLKNNTKDINTIKDEISEIKTMLRTLIDGR
jgi:hypothetical protein